MKSRHSFLFVISCMLLLSGVAKAQSDTVDVLHYDIDLDIDHLYEDHFVGRATLQLRQLLPASQIALDLQGVVVDSVLLQGQRCTAAQYTTPHLLLPAAGIAVGDTFQVTVCYHGNGYVESYDFGGFHMDENIHYNLGVAFNEYPHNFGRTWFPCRDNFHDKATYHLTITTQSGWRAFCSGMPGDVVTHPDGSCTSEWLLNHPAPTYLVSVATAPFHVIERSYQGLYDTYPAVIAFQNMDSLHVWQAYDILEDVVPMYERCLGPYRWHRIGYAGTPRGSMEHINNIALSNSCMATLSEACQSVICHELSHAWFGNLVTCATSGDMWFNEGGASFCEELAMEAAFGRAHADAYALANLESVLRTAHLDDDGYRPLYGPTPAYTYGTTVYHKGATVWHSLRGYLGDSLFYASLRTLFDRMAFGTVESHQLRDSLAAYSGVNLDDFFDFHVFAPGFVDYRIDTMDYAAGKVMLRLCAQVVGGDVLPASHRVPVTFFGPQQQSVTRVCSFQGEMAVFLMPLPFAPQFAAVNLQHDFSFAAIGDTLGIRRKGSVEMPLSHFKCNVKKLDSTAATTLYVCHHWSHPDSSPNPGILRMAHRYWTVDGILPEGSSLSGLFHYVKRGSNSSYPNLDEGFYENSATMDSLRLLYRPSAFQPWTVVGAQHTSSSSDGYFMANTLRKGEYTLAVVDESRLASAGPAQPEATQVRLFPNPSRGSFSLRWDDADLYCTITLFDPTGKVVRRYDRVASGQRIDTQLPSGSYPVQVTLPDGVTLSVDTLVVR